MNGKQLKNSILQWAIQGKLVPQDPNDEPASVLLERIRAEKARLVKEKKIKKDKNESIIYRGDDNSYYEKFLATGEVKCIDEEIPFEIPDGWEWERWGNISQSIQYGYNAPALEQGVIRMVRISDIQDNKVVWDTVPFCMIEEQDIETYLLKENDILFARTGGTVGKSFLVEEVPLKSIYAGYLIRTRYSTLLCPHYMKAFMESQLYWEQLKNGTIATAQPNCNGKTLAKMLLPIPPMNEQKRIVERLHKISPFIERYSKSQDALNLMNIQIREQLKKSVLQEAIQGKLVPQIPEEGTAQELLKRIKAEKEKLVKEGKLKKSALTDSVIYKGDDNKYYEQVGKKCLDITEQIPFEIPVTWEWCRLSNVAEIARGGSPRPIKDYLTESSNGVNWIKIGDTEKGGKYITSCIEKIKPEGVKKSRMVHIGDFLLTNSMSFGRPYITGIEGCIHDGWLVISPIRPSFIEDFLYYLLSSQYAYNQFSGKVSGAVVKNLNSDKVAASLFPLPPLKEQQRIVAQIERLFEQLK